ncbi:MAG: hypothetical protein WBQ68_06205 [Terriglobales bacterium]
MSLSKPSSPVFITEGVASGAQPVSPSLDSNQNATLINQLHGIANTNATGAGIPKQVSNVQVSVANAQTGATCTVSVLFTQDPTDKNFAGVAILVKGYQGNNQLVQVSSGISSPTKFVLNNTGENVSFTVQAYGNGGAAPLTGAPTCSASLPQSTGGGYGSSTITSPSPALQLLRSQQTILDAAELTALTTTFLAITETPPSGSRIVPAYLTVQYKFGSVDYGATGTFTFFWGSTPSAFFAYRILNGNGFLNPGTGVDQFAHCLAVSEADSGVPVPRNLIDGQPVVVGNAAAAFNSGDGLVIITAFYSIVADQ